jgi:hypothetical protein
MYSTGVNLYIQVTLTICLQVRQSGIHRYLLSKTNRYVLCFNLKANFHVDLSRPTHVYIVLQLSKKENIQNCAN